MNVFYEPIDDDDELDRERVAGETDIDTLQGWLVRQRQIESELYTLINSVQMVDAGATIGMARKLGYVRISCNWIRSRLEQLGSEAPDNAMGSKFRRVKHHLTLANQQLEKKNKQVKELRARVQELEGLLREGARP